MNEARKKIEDFKKATTQTKAASDEMAKVRLNMKLPENILTLDYHQSNKAWSRSLDDSIAQHLGVTITDQETWPEEHAQILAHEWASKLPDA